MLMISLVTSQVEKKDYPMALLRDNAHFLFSGLGLMDSNGLRVHNLFNYSTVKT